MIKIARVPLPERTVAQLSRRTAQITATALPDQAAKADGLWKSSSFRKYAKPVLRDTLRTMAPGRERCMFCGDNQGTAIDHFEPKAHVPLRTFDWLNHLLACETCNSVHKRDQFPRAADGAPLLIDPTAEDPADHLELTLAAGRYWARTDKGRETIEVLQLNRGVLVDGRVEAYLGISLWLAGWLHHAVTSQAQETARLQRLLRQQPVAEVFDAMLRQSEAPGAEDVFAGDLRTLALLRDPKLRTALQER